MGNLEKFKTVAREVCGPDGERKSSDPPLPPGQEEWEDWFIMLREKVLLTEVKYVDILRAEHHWAAWMRMLGNVANMHENTVSKRNRSAAYSINAEAWRRKAGL